MEFQIDITEPALADAAEYVRFIRDDNSEPAAAEQWFRGLVQTIYSLENHPERCTLIPERKRFPRDIRQLIYFSHRIVFSVDHQEKKVVIYRVYHGSRRRLAAGDLH